MTRSREPRAVYDVCIVGSGAGGGMAAYALTQAGARVVMLEAGGEWYASRDSTRIQQWETFCRNHPAVRDVLRDIDSRMSPWGKFKQYVKARL